MCQSVHSHVEVGDVDTHGLLSHSALVSVPGGLVVVREGDDGRANTKNHGRVNFAVGPSATVLPCKEYHQIFEKSLHNSSLKEM